MDGCPSQVTGPSPSPAWAWRRAAGGRDNGLDDRWPSTEPLVMGRLSLPLLPFSSPSPTPHRTSFPLPSTRGCRSPQAPVSGKPSRPPGAREGAGEQARLGSARILQGEPGRRGGARILCLLHAQPGASELLHPHPGSTPARPQLPSPP